MRHQAVFSQLLGKVDGGFPSRSYSAAETGS
jgi:hypothetical protein